MICWRCHEPVQGPVCPGCGVIQPPRPGLDLFGVLGLPRRWKTERDDVAAAWRQASRKVHPDRFAGKPAVERRMSLQWTAMVNQAKRVLQDDRARAHYLATGNAEPIEGRGPRLDPEFLEQIFDLQMLTGSDPAGAATQASALLADRMAAVDRALSALDHGDATAPDLASVEADLARIRYLDKTIAQAQAAT